MRHKSGDFRAGEMCKFGPSFSQAADAAKTGTVIMRHPGNIRSACGNVEAIATRNGVAATALYCGGKWGARAPRTPREITSARSAHLWQLFWLLPHHCCQFLHALEPQH